MAGKLGAAAAKTGVKVGAKVGGKAGAKFDEVCSQKSNGCNR